MGRLLPTCIASNKDSIYFVARAVSSDNVNGKPLIVLAKSEQFPTNLNNISWSIVSTVSMDQLRPFILPLYTGDNLLSVQCVVDDNGVFTVGVMRLLYQADGVDSSIRYDPNAALIDKSTTTHGNSTVDGLGEWSIASDPSNLIEDFRYVNVKNPISGNNTVYRIQFNRYEATTVIKFGPEVRGNRAETDKRITLLVVDNTTYMYRNIIYRMNGTAITDEWVSELDWRIMDYLISVPSQASAKQSNHSIITFNKVGLYSVNLSTLNGSIALQALPDIVVRINILTYVPPPPPVECGESCYFSKVMTRVIVIPSVIGALLLLCCLGFCISHCSVNRYKNPPAGGQRPAIVSVEGAENGGEPTGDNGGEVVEMETVTAEESKNDMDDQVEPADSHERSSGNVILEVVED
ncbi:hypothetical protein BGZ80_000096 [Entomortierella chlamydospora]|uniref:Uncharacterized protein n=1 Tax=Entomortierella chlamydospora TaxID=101097 RepID=A0A9P6MTJ4_9FUNG|nr:hypothetical protein BGZ80_000096 [Entomortierella chlamydospora]